MSRARGLRIPEELGREIVRTWLNDVDRNYSELRMVYHWLTKPQLWAALAYYELYPKDIDERLRVEESWTPERVYRELPFARSQAEDAR